MLSAFFIIVRLVLDLLRWCGLLLRSRESLEAENSFLRRQLALYQERRVKPKRVDAATRVTLALLSRCFDWRSALVVVRPQTLIGWHRAGFRLWWRWKSRPGRPPIPKELREQIRRMARENPVWGQERIANELLLKLGLQVSPRTVGKYMPRPAPGRPRGDQRWLTFLRNHARAIIACDFCVAVTSTFRILYVLVVIEHHSRRLIHFNVTEHPAAEWTRQQLREAVGFEKRYAYLLHDRDAIFSADLDESIRKLGLRVLKSPPRSPKANAICERVIGTIRRGMFGLAYRGMFGLAYSAVRSASASDAEILGGALQSRTPAFGLGSRRSRSAVIGLCQRRSRGIGSMTLILCVPGRCSADCITSTPWRTPDDW